VATLCGIIFNTSTNTGTNAGTNIGTNTGTLQWKSLVL
jgi:hypothetical protein